MSSNWKAPPRLKEPYISWKEELAIWEAFTDLDKKKQGPALFLSLPNPSSARDAVLELGATVINGADGVKLILQKLDSLFLKDVNILKYQAWRKFIRPSNMNMSDYTIEFNKLYTLCKSNGLALPSGVLAIQYLDSANLSDSQHKLALATCAKMEYEDMKSQVLKISTDINIPTTSKILQQDTPSANKLLQADEIKVENTQFAEYYEGQDTQLCNTYDDEEYEEDVEASDTLYGYGYSGRGRYNNTRSHRGQQQRPYYRSNSWQTTRNTGAANEYSSRGHYQNRGRTRATSTKGERPKQINQPDKFGRPRQCRECLSVYHLEEKCPELDSNITLLTDEVTPKSKLLEETIGCMIVDSGCINTVCGTDWLESYIDTLSCRDKKTITVTESNSKFRFGNGAAFCSLKKVILPIYLGNLRTTLSTDVVECEIPLLFSKNSLKRGNGTIQSGE